MRCWELSRGTLPLPGSGGGGGGVSVKEISEEVARKPSPTDEELA